jgi:hypothetical protein
MKYNINEQKLKWYFWLNLTVNDRRVGSHHLITGISKVLYNN